jgi:hypothetical protein
MEVAVDFKTSKRRIFTEQHDEPTWASALGVVCLAMMFLVLAFI